MIYLNENLLQHLTFSTGIFSYDGSSLSNNFQYESSDNTCSSVIGRNYTKISLHNARDQTGRCKEIMAG